MTQLSLIPDLVPAKAEKKAQTSARQLTLNILGSVATVPANTKPKQVLSTSEAWYNGKLCTVLKRSKEDFDGVVIKICTIRTHCGGVLDVPENHITIL
ncbi:MAG: hypothetical protein DCE90_17990 [Pseudanabaena sp.]|nr:MAG: hypothetical protein DCE90_17990 [Pseudanabaena sp.]